MRRSALLAIPVLAAIAAGGWWMLGRDARTAPLTPLDDASAGGEEVVADAGPELRGGPRATTLGAVPTVASPYRILGVVNDEKGQPVEGVLVRAHANARTKDPADTASWGDPKADDAVRKSLSEIDDPKSTENTNDPAATTDKEGKFEIPVTSFGSYTLQAFPAAGRVGAWAWANLTRDKPVGHVTIKLLPGAALSGRVVDVGDKGVASFVSAVWTVVPEEGNQTIVNIPQVQSDASGAFTLVAVPDGKGALTVRVAGRGTFGGFKVVTPTKEEVVLRIGGGGVVRGRVVDTTGQAVAAADVSISTSATRSVPDGSARNALIRGKTGPDGTYRIEGLVPGAVKSVMVAAAGYVSLTQYVPAAKWSGTEVKDGVEATIDLVLFRGGSVKGRVFDKTEKDSSSPVANAEVFLLGAPSGTGGQAVPRVATVDKDGAFRFDEVPLGKYVLYARSPTHYVATGLDGGPSLPGGRMIRTGGEANAPATSILVLSKDGETFEKNIFMLKGLPVSGIVKGPDGVAVEGAKVTSGTNDPFTNMSWQYGLQPQGAMVLATSGPDGSFQVPGLPPGDQVTLTAKKPPLAGKPSKPFKVSADAPTEKVTLELEKGGSIAGRVVDAEGKGVVGVNVQCWNQNGAGNADATTGAEGAFKLEGLGAGTYQLWCWSQTGGNAQKMLDPELKAGEDREGVELKLTAAAKTSKLSGTLVDEEGNPVPDRQLQAQGANGSNGWAQTDSDGSFTFYGLQAGKVTISSMTQTAEGYSTSEPLSTTTYDAPGEGIKVVVTKKTTTVVAGRVVLPDGSPCPLCFVTTKAAAGAKSAGGSGAVMAVPVNGYGGGGGSEVVNGEFRREVATKPPFDLVVSNPRDAEGRPLNLRSKTTPITESNTSLEIKLEGGQELRGKVLAADGAPVTGAYVQATGTASSDRTVEDGSFRLVGLEGDEISITVQPMGKYVAPAQPTKAKPGATDVVIRLEAGLAIAGRVVDAAGTAITNGYVQVMGTTGSNRRSFGAQLDASGAFRAENLPKDGVYDVMVQVWNPMGGKGVNYKPWSKSGVRAGTEDLLIRLEGGESMEGFVVDGDGKPVSGAWVNATSVAGGKSSTGANTDEQGRFTIGGLEPGLQVVRAQQWNGTQRQSLPVRAEAGARDVRLVFPSTVKLLGRVVGDGDKQGFQVAVRLPGPITADDRGGGSIAYAQSMADGTFSVDVPVDTLVDVAAMKQSDDRWGLASGVRGGGAEITVRVEVGKTIEGVLEDADGNPVTQNAWISATSESWLGNGSIDATGKFKIRALAPGHYKLRVQNSMGGRNASTIEADAGATGVRFRLSNS